MSNVQEFKTNWTKEELVLIGWGKISGDVTFNTTDNMNVQIVRNYFRKYLKLATLNSCKATTYSAYEQGAICWIKHSYGYDTALKHFFWNMENSTQEEIQLKRGKTHYKKFAKWYELVMTKITEDEVLKTGHEAILKPEWLEKKVLHHPLKVQHVHKRGYSDAFLESKKTRNAYMKELYTTKKLKRGSVIDINLQKHLKDYDDFRIEDHVKQTAKTIYVMRKSQVSYSIARKDEEGRLRLDAVSAEEFKKMKQYCETKNAQRFKPIQND